MDPVGVVLPTPPYLPFMDGPAPSGEENFRWRLGARPLDLRDWIELGPDADAAIAAKPRLMADHPDTVFAVLDDVEARDPHALGLPHRTRQIADRPDPPLVIEQHRVPFGRAVELDDNRASPLDHLALDLHRARRG